MSNYRQRAKEQSKELGGDYQPHPVGDYSGTVTEVKIGDYEGSTFYRIMLQTNIGKICSQTIWETTTKDIEGKLATYSQNREEAEGKYVKAMARICRLYTDLGLPEPDGENDEQFEKNCYDNLGKLVGRSCKVVVKANPDRPQNPYVYINAPEGGAKAVGNVTQTNQQTAATKPAGLDDIPF